MLTQNKLKELLHYNPETGIFTWVSRPSNRIYVGKEAGNKIKNGYIIIGVCGSLYLAHRLAWLYMTGEWPESQIDHKDHVRNNNIFFNLRKATNLENSKNKSPSKNNTSGITGVYWAKHITKWMSSIGIDRKQKHIGVFNDKWDAICARKSAENKYGFHKNHGQSNI